MNVHGHFACHRGTKHLKIKSTHLKISEGLTVTSPRNSPGPERCGKSETIVKAYPIPIQADEVVLKFIEEYHKMAKIVLEEILNAERFTKFERKKLRDKLLKNWKYVAHYVDSAINQMQGLVKSYKKKLKRGKKTRKPRLRKKFVYVKSTLFRLKGTILKITIIPRDYYIEIDLSKYAYILQFLKEIQEGKLRLGGLFLFADIIVLNFVKTVEYFASITVTILPHGLRWKTSLHTFSTFKDLKGLLYVFLSLLLFYALDYEFPYFFTPVISETPERLPQEIPPASEP